jgi:putative phage-type endonuclease
MSKRLSDARRIGIGGSDIAAMLGLSLYKSTYELWNEKVHGEFKDLSDNAAVLYGSLLEDMLAQKYQGDNFDTVASINRRCPTIFHSDHDYLMANMDGFVFPANKEEKPYVLEIKTASLYSMNRWGDDGGSKVPEEYLLQVAHYMAVSNSDKAVIFVGFLNDWVKDQIAVRLIKARLDKEYMFDLSDLMENIETRTYYFNRDMELEKKLLASCEDFWFNHVKTKIPPEKDYTNKGLQEYINTKFKKMSVDVSKGVYNYSDELTSKRAELMDLNVIIKEAEIKKDQILSEFKDLLNESGLSVGRFSDGSGYIKQVFNKYYKPSPGRYKEEVRFNYFDDIDAKVENLLGK